MKPIKLDSILQFNFLGNVKTNPSESCFAFLKAKANLDKNHYDHTLYVQDEGKIKKVRELKKNNAYLFLNDDTILLNYQKNKAEQKLLKESFKQTYYTYHLKEKRLEKAFVLPFPASVEDVLDENTLLISASMTKDDHALYEADEENRKAYIKQKKKDKLYEDIEELPFIFNGRDFINNLVKQYFLYDIASNQVTRLFNKDFTVNHYTLTPSKDAMIFAGKEKESLMNMTSNVYRYTFKTQNLETLYDKRDYNIVKIILLQDKIICAAKDMQTFGLNQNIDFFSLDNQQLILFAPFKQAFGNTTGTDVRLIGTESSFIKEDTFYFVSTIDDHSELFALNSKGDLKSIYTMDGAIDGIVKYQDHAIMVGLKGQSLQALYAYDFNKKSLEKLTTFNDEILKDTYVAKPEVVTVDKVTHEVKGFMLYPKDYDATKQYPAILNIHGGPKTVYGQIFYHEMQFWASEGYFVLFANPKGSDGKGDEFADIRGKYGTVDYEDLMDFVDACIEKTPSINQESLYVTGGSYGGFMTNWIVGHTNRFKAAATQRSISNWLSFYGTSDIGYYFASDQTAGHPIFDLEKLYEQSPIKYAMNIKTPLLFIHSDKDHRCPIEQAQQLYAILKTNHVDTKLVWIKDENHELSRSGKPQARLKRLSEITNWFKNHA
ncbi:MAG: alpha/beta hydrolase family protein [Candidatus Izemoplasmataceae bacterium]